MSGDFLPKRVERYPRDRPLCVSFECDSSSEELEKKERREEISGSGFTHGSGASLIDMMIFFVPNSIYAPSYFANAVIGRPDSYGF